MTKEIICIATTQPSSSLTSSGGGGSLAMMCPRTGSILSSLRATADMSGKVLGMSSVSLFPNEFANSNNHLAISYGKNISKSNDTYAMLVTLRQSSSPPILHWKCRLPETDLTAGLKVSPCGHYIAGGGSSGMCYIWGCFGGMLLRVFNAHYRACTCLAWSECGRYLLTAGGDGMVHAFSLMDLVDRSFNVAGSSKLEQQQQQRVPPLHTWSVHQLPVTCLLAIGGERFVSSSEDGQVVVMEAFSQIVVATLQLPHGILCLEHHDGRLYAGSTQGEICAIDLNAYSMHKTTSQGASSTKRRRLRHVKADMSIEDRVFGLGGSSPSEALGNSGENTIHQYEFKGHERPVTCLAFLVEEYHQERLISGDESGVIRIWDVGSRTCLRVVQPWSSFDPSSQSRGLTTRNQNSTSSQPRHPVTSIAIVQQAIESPKRGSESFSASYSAKNGSIMALVPPLQRFPSENQESTSWTPIPFLRPLGNSESLNYWDIDASYRETHHRKPFDSNADSSRQDRCKENLRSGAVARAEAHEQRIIELEKELEEQKSQVRRWEKVNNKLMAKLEAAKKGIQNS